MTSILSSAKESELRVVVVQAPDVLFVKAVDVPVGRLQSGSSLSIRFSHDTNMPPVLRRADLRRVLTLNPPSLANTSHMAIWTEPHTLSVIFPAMSRDGSMNLTQVLVSFKSLSGTFHLLQRGTMLLSTVWSALENCNSTDVCQYGVCHADGWSCRVTGTYRVDQTEKHALNSDNHNTMLAA